MESFLSWFRREPRASVRPWLILGKGPSFDRRLSLPLGDFNLLGLNHVCRVQPVLLTHVTDLDVLAQCHKELAANSEYLVMPRYPHVSCKPGKRSLAELVLRDPVVCDFERRGRLLCYNSDRARGRPHGPGPVVRVRLFSAVAAFNLLGCALADVFSRPAPGPGKESAPLPCAMPGDLRAQLIYTLGVDGGRRYAAPFDLSTKLLNGRPSFDGQDREIEAACKLYGVRHRRLAPAEP